MIDDPAQPAASSDGKPPTNELESAVTSGEELQLAMINAAEALSAALALLKPDNQPHPQGLNIVSIEQGYRDRDYFSGKVSEISRQLGFAGIGIIWVFKVGEGPLQTVRPTLVPAALALTLGLTFDLLQYLLSTALWQRFTKQAHTQGKTEFVAPKWINRPGWGLFIAKVVAIGLAYVYLILFLMSGMVIYTIQWLRR